MKYLIPSKNESMVPTFSKLDRLKLPVYVGFFKICFALYLCTFFMHTYSYAAPNKIKGKKTKNIKVRGNKRKLKKKKIEKKVDETTKKEVATVEKQQSDADKALLQNKKIKSIWLSSAFMPGLGQIYNNKIWKTGVIWVGFAGLFGGAWYFHKKYMFIDEKSALKRDRTEVDYRIYRNGCFVASFFWYVLNVLDAYVDAHMTTFDISKNLTSDNVIGEEKKRAIMQEHKKNKKRKKRKRK